MATSVLNFPASEAVAEIHCGECAKGIDPDKQIATYCADCNEWLCRHCEHCGCDRLALLVQRSLNRLQPSVWTRVRRWFNHGI